MKVEGFDSKEEKWFNYYLSELKQKGYINEFYYQPETFTLCDEYHKNVFVKRKNHNKPTEVKLLNGAVYSPDFLIEWNKKAHGILFWWGGGVYEQGATRYSKPRRDAFIPFVAQSTEDQQIVSWIDVKGTFGMSDRSFSLTQKWVASKGLFVQKIVISLCEKGLFYRSGFPRVVVAEETYKKDYKRGGKTLAHAGDSKIKVEIKLLEHWLKRKENG